MLLDCWIAGLLDCCVTVLMREISGLHILKPPSPEALYILQLYLQLAFAHSSPTYNLRLHLCITHYVRDALGMRNVLPYRMHYIRATPCLCPTPCLCDSIGTFPITLAPL